jgi:hypothetical protein
VIHCLCFPARGCLHRLDVGSVVDVSKVFAAFIFKLIVNRIGEFSCMYRFGNFALYTAPIS